MWNCCVLGLSRSQFSQRVAETLHLPLLVYRIVKQCGCVRRTRGFSMTGNERHTRRPSKRRRYGSLAAARFTSRKSRAFSVILSTTILIAFLNSARAAAVTIVALGASSTGGWGVGQQAAYPALIEESLKARGYDAHVINAGGLLTSTSVMLANLNTTVPNGTSVVLLDTAPLSDRINGLSRAQSKENVSSIISYLRARNIEIIMVDVPSVSEGFVQLDGVHPSAQGHETAAMNLLPRVMAAIGRRHR
jgi:acyl-CoA thioesterase I